MTTPNKRSFSASASPTGRPRGIAALSGFFMAGTAMAGTCAVALSFPGGVLEPIWRLKPDAHEVFETLGATAIALMAAVAVACAGAAIGLWRGARWGRRLAMGVLAINLVGDALNATLGRDARAWIGVPITALLLAYLGSRRVKQSFASASTKP